MFTGIIETLGTITAIRKTGSNIDFDILSKISSELKIDQSVAHNGVCLTVTNVNLQDSVHTVTAIEETLQKTSLGQLKKNTKVNLERAMPANGRFDGHVVQGHVDQTAVCTGIDDRDGSKLLTFKIEGELKGLIVPKGSVCIDGISLTVVDCEKKDNHFQFRLAIIPYTWENTHLHQLKTGSIVNVEFDIIGKYVAAAIESRGE